MKRLLSVFDARDACAGVGLLLVYVGLAGKFGHDVALVVIGGILLVKSLTRWV